MSQGFVFRAAKLQDLNPDVGTEYAIGVNLRTAGVVGSSSSAEVGVTNNPLIVKSPVYFDFADGFNAGEADPVYTYPTVYNALDALQYFQRQAQVTYSGAGCPQTGLPAVALMGYFNSSKTSETNFHNTFNHVQIGDRQQVFVTIRDDTAGIELGTAASPLFVAPGTSYKGGAVTAFSVIDAPHHEIHEGDTFWVDDVVTIPTATPQDYLITTPNTTEWAHWGYEVEGTEAGFTLEVFEASTHTGTTLLTTVNRNRNSAHTATTTVHRGAASGADGTKIVWWTSGTTTAGGKAAGNAGEATERILKKNTKYLFRITTLTNNKTVSVRFNWYEHTSA